MSCPDSPDPDPITQENNNALAASSRLPLSRKLWGGFLIILGYLLSPLCWWNDLIFNMPVAYGFGYLCSLFSPNLFLPGAIVGYWLSNLVGVLLMQFGAVEVIQTQPNSRDFSKELLMGVATSTVYTLVVVAIVQFKLVDLSAFIPDEGSFNYSTLLPFFRSGN
jgi:hypothetical protein